MASAQSIENRGLTGRGRGRRQRAGLHQKSIPTPRAGSTNIGDARGWPHGKEPVRDDSIDPVESDDIRFPERAWPARCATPLRTAARKSDIPAVSAVLHETSAYGATVLTASRKGAEESPKNSPSYDARMVWALIAPPGVPVMSMPATGAGVTI